MTREVNGTVVWKEHDAENFLVTHVTLDMENFDRREAPSAKQLLIAACVEEHINVKGAFSTPGMSHEHELELARERAELLMEDGWDLAAFFWGHIQQKTVTK